MKEITFYRWSALLPIVLPVLAFTLFWDTGPVRNFFEQAVSLIVGTGVMGAPAYAVFAMAMLWWLRGKPVDTYRRVSLVAPLLFFPIFILQMLLLEYREGHFEPPVTMIQIFLPYVLGTAYAYVALVHILRITLSYFGLINSDEGAV